MVYRKKNQKTEPVVDSEVVELIPKFKKVEDKKIQEADTKTEEIKRLRSKLEVGAITDGEAAQLYNLLSE
jgi:hypothetical protein